LSAIAALLGQVELERDRHAPRLAQHVLAQLACLGSHTVTGLLTTCGEQFRDWSAHYRMYGRERIDPQRLFDVIRAGLCAGRDGPVVAAMDDTRLRKSGRKVHGAKYMRDPLSPPFHTNLIRAQRFVQTSVALAGADGQARMLPVDWVHAPLPPKPGRGATAAQWAHYRDRCRQDCVSRVGAGRLAHLRQWLDRNAAPARRLWAAVDGSFTNRTVIRSLPHDTVLVGRVRADAKLHHLPTLQPARGRRRHYGERAPTPEQLRLDPDHPWETVQVHFGGQLRQLRAKRLGPLLWRAAGAQCPVQVVVVAPTPYRIGRSGRLLYRQPAYLLCTDPEAPLRDLIQYFLWRWDIEVNFRDQKTILGLGEAQVRTPAATANLTAVAVAAYAMLLLAAERCRWHDRPAQHLPAPKWQRRQPRRATTMSLIQGLRHDLWAESIHSVSFAFGKHVDTKPQKLILPLDSALLYASKCS
jgi:hypothetical protein